MIGSGVLKKTGLNMWVVPEEILLPGAWWETLRSNEYFYMQKSRGSSRRGLSGECKLQNFQ